MFCPPFPHPQLGHRLMPSEAGIPHPRVRATRTCAHVLGAAGASAEGSRVRCAQYLSGIPPVKARGKQDQAGGKPTQQSPSKVPATRAVLSGARRGPQSGLGLYTPAGRRPRDTQDLGEAGLGG